MSEFCAQPIGGPLACGAKDPCAPGWAAVNAEVGKIDAMPDIRERNKAISASYAKLYMAAPELKWAGAAAFASKQVGCGMDTAHTYLDDYPGGPAAVARDQAMAGGGMPVGIDPVTATMYDARQTLGKGNLAVYDELYPALRFYQQNKATMDKAQILNCLEHKPGLPLDPSIMKGVEQTMDGKGKEGAMTMLWNEQSRTLQKAVYDESWMFRRSLDMNRITGYPPITFVVSADCTSPDPGKIVDFANYKGALYDLESRWPFAQECANRFVQLADSPTTADAVKKSLEQIANGAKVP